MNRIATGSALALMLAGCGEPGVDPERLGYVEADWAYVAAPAAGWIIEQPVTRGSRIEFGDLLFTLDSELQQAAVAETRARASQAEAQLDNLTTGARAPELRALKANLSEARARLAQARAERDRVLPLVKRGVEPATRGDAVVASYDAALAAVRAAEENITVAEQAGRPAEVEAATAAHDSATAAVASAEYHLGQRRVTAALDGRVEDCLFEPGEYVLPGNPVLAVLPDDGLHVRFFVSQQTRPGIKVGQHIEVAADGLPEPVSAEIRYIASAVEFTPPVIYAEGVRNKLRFEVEASLPPGTNLAPGLPVTLHF